MKYRKFGKTDLMVSEIGFGAWAIGGNAVVGSTPIGWGTADDNTSKKAVHKALDAGINFFDTADFYGLGHSETLLGEILSDTTEVVIATKVGHRNIDDAIVLDYSKEYIISACDKSLKRLRRESIDYYQLHSARMQHLQNGECIEAMEYLKKQGKIRYWGTSLNTFDPYPEGEFLLSRNIGDGLQVVFNILNQRAYNLIKNATNLKHGIIARMPLQFGLLTGKFSSSITFNKDDHRSFRLKDEVLQKTLHFLNEKVWPITDKEQLTKTQLALSFILSVPDVSTVIPGIRTSEHIMQNTVGLKKLSDDVFHYLLSMADKELKPIMELLAKAG